MRLRREKATYAASEVESLFDELRLESGALWRAHLALVDRVKALQEQVQGYAAIEESLRETLLAAEIAAEQLRADAQGEAEEILRDARQAAGVANTLDLPNPVVGGPNDA